MSELEFDPEKAIGEGLLKMDRQELCRFVARLCLHLQAELGSHAWRGGIYPENICVGEDGAFAIGPGRTEKWSGQELEFVAPELYWHGETGPAADVYSLALLIFYGLNGGKLPFETATSSGQLARMSGKAFPIPKGAGKRLGEVLEKATAFQPSDRYESPEQFGIVLESCLDNKYLDGESGAKVVFRKQEGELSDLERMMVDIIERSGEEEADEPEEEPLPVAEELSPEEMAGLEKPEPVEPEKEDLAAAVEEYFGGETSPEADADPSDEPEDVRLYEPGQDKKDRQPIPILTVEKNPELEPVVLSQRPRFSRIRQQQEPELTQEEKVKERRRIRPLTVVLILCALLLTGAIVANIILYPPKQPAQINPTPDPSNYYAQSTEEPFAAEETQPPQPEQSEEPVVPQPHYQIVTSDMSWKQARDACVTQGGHLAVISTREEFEEITAMADAQGLKWLWIGCRRVDGEFVWVTDDPVDFSQWAANEPSGWDDFDGVPENYVMIIRKDDGWYYNDSRNDPASDYPQYYSGVMGYVCEFDS